MKIAPADGLGPLRLITSWPLLRYLDARLVVCGENGSAVVKVRKGRVAGAEATEQTSWLAAEAA